MSKAVLTTIDNVKEAMSKSKYASAFTVTSTEKSESNSYCFINLLNEEKKATSQTCFIIGFNRKNYRFSSNASFENCNFLKEAKVNTKNRYEITVAKDDIVKVIDEACADYCKRHKIKITTTASKKQASKQKEA